jgi:hypothetical protein
VADDPFGPVIYEYTLQQAIEDGVLVEIFKNLWPELSGDKPIVATSHLFSEVSLAGLREIWMSTLCGEKTSCRPYRRKSGCLAPQ